MRRGGDVRGEEEVLEGGNGIGGASRFATNLLPINDIIFGCWGGIWKFLVSGWRKVGRGLVAECLFYV